MPNPYLPSWEYIPDGEPRVFGDRIYIYGSHDRKNSDRFCDYKLKAWSAPLSDPGNWVCHGHIFHTAPDRDHESSVTHSSHELFAPDVVEKDGKYYLYTYIFKSKGCVSVSDKPEGPFQFISCYQYSEGHSRDDGIFNDPGVLIDDDGRVYIYCGFTEPYMAELNPDNMYEVLEGTHKIDVVPPTPPFNYFEGSSPRKIGDTYYFIYCPTPSSRLDYATSQSPTGPFTYGGTIVDNAIDYPGGNNHGSIACLNGQWYVFYHKMTNGTILSRRACAERITIKEDGSIPQVEMTSLGFDESLNPFVQTPAEWACVLKGGCLVTERNVFERPITGITDGAVIGYKYFDFGKDFSSKSMKIALKVRGLGCRAKVKVMCDSEEESNEIGVLEIDSHDGIYEGIVKNLTGCHAVYFIIGHGYDTSDGWDWALESFKTRQLFDLESFVFLK